MSIGSTSNIYKLIEKVKKINNTYDLLTEILKIMQMPRKTQI